MTALRNEMILASAGSGKTYRLTNRFVHLLALGVPPERVIALTFTRKAAAEFLDEILRKLSKAASSEEFAAQLREDLELPEFSTATATKLLREVVDKLHLLTLGTLDGFFNRILRCFPAEFGLSAKFDILADYEAKVARREVFASLFRNREIHADFAESFKLATFGMDEKMLVSRLDSFVAQYHGVLLQAPENRLWGEPNTLWPGGCEWLEGIPDVNLEAEQLLLAIEKVDLQPRVLKMWDEFIDLLRSMRPGRKRPPAKSLQKRLFEQFREIKAGGPIDLTLYGQTITFGKDVCSHLSRLLDYFMFCEVFPYTQRTRGIHYLLAAFEEQYQQQVRRAGKLGFDDIQLLLSGALTPDPKTLSLDGADGRLHIDYRLDGQFDHWLLDEFQDTSLPQWKVIENLVDEVVQDLSDERSFFYVGDVKQAIFGWRGGDSRLFDDIQSHYADPSEPRITKETMEDSWRSGPSLLAAVNEIFGQREVFRELFPEHEPFVSRWFQAWRPHRSHFAERKDFFQLLNVPRGEKGDAPSLERRIEVVANLLVEIAPHEKNLSCAILVRKNSTALQVADFIRATTDIPVVIEGDTLIGTDHPIAASFLALLQLAAHPGDELAWKHLCMTPAFPDADWAALLANRRELTEATLRIVHDAGFAGVFESWLVQLIEGGFAPDDFAKRRIEQLRQATREFDQTGSRSISEFVRYALAFTGRETPAKGVVQIMTIHKSKGLGFDAVVVAEIEGVRDDSLTDLNQLSLVANRSGEGMRREIEWVFSMPRKDVCELDPTLAAARAKLENEKAFEELCVLYVALTRAKYANYVVCTEPGKKSTCRKLMGDSLAWAENERREKQFGSQEAFVAYETGYSDWHKQPAFQLVPEIAPEEPPSISLVTGRRRFPFHWRAMPSSAADEADESSQAANFAFLPNSRRAADYGTKVHELFEQVSWLDSVNLTEILKAEIDETDEMEVQALDEVLRNFADPAIAEIFQRSSFPDNAEVWREKRFELINDGKWISGTFDRVVVARESDGRVSQTWIYDFKTNRVSNEHEIQAACDHYRPQLAIYRTAISQLLGIDDSDVSTTIIFTRKPLAVEVKPLAPF